MKERVIINEVGPRDGLQNQPRTLTVVERVQLIQALADAGLRHIEVGSFVSPKAVPQMAATDTVMAALPARPGVEYSVLIPNLKGYERARAAGARKLALVLSATDTMSLKNIGMNMEQVFAVASDIIARSRAEGLFTQACISVAFECPFEGVVDPAVVENLTARLFAAGADEVVIADTIGAGNPVQVRRLLDRLVAQHGAERLAVHFHDTRAFAIANCFAALEAGIRRFDSSIGGLGGCPFVPGASGNVATEDVVLMLEQSGFDTGVDIRALIAAALLAERLTGNCPGPRSKLWVKKQYGMSAGVPADTTGRAT
jgi:hydroxymethylglutaryl-CoA lyase